MNWDEWYKHYDSLPGLQERLRIVREQIVAALNECPAGQIQIVSICAGDGRDLIGALQNHPRRDDVSALLLDNHAESIARGEAAGKKPVCGVNCGFSTPTQRRPKIILVPSLPIWSCFPVFLAICPTEMFPR